MITAVSWTCKRHQFFSSQLVSGKIDPLLIEPLIIFSRKYYKQLSYLVHITAVVALLFGSIHIYRVSYLVMGALALIALHQIVAPCRPWVPQAQDTPSRSNLPYMAQVGTEDASYSDCNHSEATTASADMSLDTGGSGTE